jgi:outer membrane protein assembly factor BamD (BamD/ComL family)
MHLIKGFVKTGLIYLLLVSIAGCNTVKSNARDNQTRPGKEVIEKADQYLGRGEYENYRKLLRTFIEKYPESEYADDALYRLAYLHVVWDRKNPFHNYREARQSFMDFVVKFPKSRYFDACNNWLKILNSYFELKTADKPVIQKVTRENCSELERKNRELAQENEKLREILKDLEAALER